MRDLEPELVDSDRVMGDSFAHPAYGVVTLSQVRSSQGERMFGSDLPHDHFVRIDICHATLRRKAGSETPMSDNRPAICSIEMSYAQFVAFVMSGGDGGGTPCSVRYIQGEEVPGIACVQDKGEALRAEVQDSAYRAVSESMRQLEAWMAMVDAGRMGKKEMREKVRGAMISLGNLPSNLGYSIEVGQQAIDQGVHDAKIDIEAFMSTAAQRVGFASLQAVGESADRLVQQAGDARPAALPRAQGEADERSVEVRGS